MQNEQFTEFISLKESPNVITNYIASESNLHLIPYIEYDETLYFFHNQSSSQKFEDNSSEIFPYLTSVEFLYSKDSSIENDMFMEHSELSKDELKHIIISKRINKFHSNMNNKTFCKSFLYNMFYYAKIIDISLINSLLLPSIDEVLLSLSEENLSLALKSIYQITSLLIKRGEKGTEVIKDKILSLLFKLFTKEFLNNKMIKNLIFDIMKLIAHNLNKDELGITMLSKVIEISNGDANGFDESLRIENLLTVIKLIRNLVSAFGCEYTERFILPQAKMLSTDKSVLIRKEICKLLSTISHEISITTHISKLRPLFVSLCNDIDSSVKIESIYILPSLMKDNKEKSNFEESNEFYINQYTMFMYDNDKAVRIATLDIFGKFIMLLTIDELDKKYLDFYKNTIDEYYFYHSKEFINRMNQSILVSSAINFAAVLYRFGKSSWEILKFPYMQMLHDNDENVVCSLLNSFHEIISILGDDVVKRDLIQTYDNFLESKNETIKRKSIDTVSNVIKALSDVEMRKKYIYYIKKYIIVDMDNIDSNSSDKENKIVFKNYRDKLSISENIERYFSLFDDETIENLFLRIEIILSYDEMEIVRKVSAKALAKIIVYLYQKRKKEMILIIKSFALNDKFKMRNQFLVLCRSLLSSNEIFDDVYDLIVNCIFDDVIDVRIQTAKLIASVSNQENFELNFLLKNKKFLILMWIITKSPLYEKILKYISIRRCDINEDIQKEADAIAEGHSSIKHSNEYFNRMTQQMKIII